MIRAEAILPNFESIQTGGMLTREELLTREFDMPFRKDMRRTVHELQRVGDFHVPEILTPTQLKFLHYSLQGQRTENRTSLRWMRESEIMRQSGFPKDTEFRDLLVGTVARIYRRSLYGPRALEILKIEDEVLYRTLATSPYTTVDQLRELEYKKLALLNLDRAKVFIFESHMQEIFSNYHIPTESVREVVFDGADSVQKREITSPMTMASTKT